MTVDDAVTGRATLAASPGLLVIRPTTAGEEWTIHNIYVPFGKKVSLYWSNDPTGVDKGVNIGPIPYSLLGQYNFHCTNTDFLILVNGEATETKVGYDGVVTNTS
jgi:hypothetical protein